MLILDSTSDGKTPADDYKPDQDFGKGQVADECQSNFRRYKSNMRRKMAPKVATSVLDNPILWNFRARPKASRLDDVAVGGIHLR